MTPKAMERWQQQQWRRKWRREREQFQRENPGRELTSAALIEWRIAKNAAADAVMRQAWLDEHPGEPPLPEHFCVLDRPFPGHKRWAAKVKRWLNNWEAAHPPGFKED